ncbi:MAG: UDP-N-acetylmuramate dehydrogenase [Chlamydiales bacterium]
MMNHPPFNYQREKQLSEFSSFAIGGSALYFAEARTYGQMQQMLIFAYRNGLSFFILGKGSNCLFDDRGYHGLVIRNRIDYLNQQENVFTAGGGYSFARLGKVTARLGWSGLEFAAGIPATVGGAIFMNAGANGQETADTLTHVDYVSEAGEMSSFSREQLTFDYRTSPFQQMKGAIVGGAFRLKDSQSAKRDQNKNLNDRLKTQPYSEKSAGCVFRNPQNFSAGQLIEESGLKGYQIGGACVSKKHANFIVNTGGAKASDVLQLIETIKEKVYQKKGILLREEIRYIPYLT